MNGVNKLKACESGERDEENDDEDDLAKPSTSRAGLVGELQWNTSTRELYEGNLKSSCSSQKTGLRRNVAPRPGGRERLSSNTDSTSSDDSCVYMYKGDGVQRNGVDANKPNDCSSPEMDYLEMDFDPCHSNDRDSSDGSYNCDVPDFGNEEGAAGPTHNLETNSNEEERITPNSGVSMNHSPNLKSAENQSCDSASAPSVSNRLENVSIENDSNVMVTERDDNTNQQENDSSLQNPKSSSTLKISDSNNLSSTPEPHGSEASSSVVSSIEAAVDCTEESFILKKHFLESTSQYNYNFGHVSCCVTTLCRAVNNLIGVEDPVEEVQEELNTVDVSITDLLFKFSHGYLTIPKIQEIVNRTSKGMLTTKFVEAKPPILSNLSSWLQYWLKKDAVIFLCTNFQLSDEDCSNVVNPSWHYLLVRGVTSKGVQVFPHMETIPEETLKKLFLNPSEVLIMKDYIVVYWTPMTNLKPLINCSDASWRQYNVLGQVVNVVRDAMTGKSDDEIRYIKVPSPHRTGILLIMRSDSVHLQDLEEIEGAPIS